jgi:DNA primase
MEHDHLSFIEAIESLASQAGMQVPEQSPAEIERASRQKDLYELLDQTARWFEGQLNEAAYQEAKAYLEGRGVNEDLCRRFRVGFAPDDSRALWTYLKGQGFTEQQAIDCGVVRRSDRDGSLYSFFRDRIIFPVSDQKGRIVAFGGRVLPEHLRPPSRDGRTPPKYINSSDSPLFQKGHLLYGGSHARQAARDGKPILVVEGYLDVIAAHTIGYTGAVAPLGTALTEEQILLLWKMIPDQSKLPVLCFDGDNAGRRAAARAFDRVMPLLKPDHSVLFAFLPEGQDPDSLIRTGLSSNIIVRLSGKNYSRASGHPEKGRSLHKNDLAGGTKPIRLISQNRLSRLKTCLI